MAVKQESAQTPITLQIERTFDVQVDRGLGVITAGGQESESMT